MKVRVLYPTAMPDFDGNAGDEVNLPDDQAAAFIAAGFVEATGKPKATRSKSDEKGEE